MSYYFGDEIINAYIIEHTSIDICLIAICHTELHNHYLVNASICCRGGCQTQNHCYILISNLASNEFTRLFENTSCCTLKRVSSGFAICCYRRGSILSTLLYHNYMLHVILWLLQCRFCVYCLSIVKLDTCIRHPSNQPLEPLNIEWDRDMI